MTMRATGSGVRRLATGRWIRALVWSPRGGKLAFIAENPSSGESGLFVIRSDGTGRRRLLVGAASFDWSPDGRRLVVAVRDGLVVIGPGGTGRRLTTASDNAPAWSPDGAGIAFLRGGKRCAPKCLLLVQLRGKRVRVLSRRAAGAPAWAPGGRRVAFPAHLPLGRRAVAIVDSDRTAEWLATRPLPRMIGSIRWSLAGRQLLFEQELGGGAWAVFLVRPHGSGFRLVSRGSDPDWSPHGGLVALARKRPCGGTGIAVISVGAGRRERMLTPC